MAVLQIRRGLTLKRPKLHAAKGRVQEVYWWERGGVAPIGPWVGSARSQKGPRSLRQTPGMLAWDTFDIQLSRTSFLLTKTQVTTGPYAPTDGNLM